MILYSELPVCVSDGLAAEPPDERLLPGDLDYLGLLSAVEECEVFMNLIISFVVSTEE